MNKGIRGICLLASLCLLLGACQRHLPDSGTMTEGNGEPTQTQTETVTPETESAREKREREDREDREMAERDFEENKTMTFEGKTYELTFIDSFNGHRLDRTKWEYCPNWTRDQCVWTDREAYLQDGNLILNVSGDGVPYRAGAIRTHSRFEQTYGYFEVRCRLQQIRSGICSSFWLMSYEMNDAVLGAEDGAEIDIFEAVPGHKPSYVQHALHWDGYGDNHKSWNFGIERGRLYIGYHTFALLWDEEGYRFFIDGKETASYTGDVCRVPCYLKLTAAVGGWTGELDPSKLPIPGLEVDYVKVYKEVKP